MPTETVTFEGTREELNQLLSGFFRALVGDGPDPHGVVRGIQLRLGVALLSKIQQAFIVKARGGTDECGIKWPPLKRSTIAQRRTTREERAALGIGGKRVRGLLTTSEDARWRKLFATRKNWLKAKYGLSDREASARAASIAWATLKREGAKTKLEVLGGRQVETLRDTGELLRSLSPGVEDRPSGAEGQVFRTEPGRVIVGTNKKPWHHRGIPGRLPARHLWPPDGDLPPAWWEALLGVAQRGTLRALVLVLQRYGGKAA